LGYGSKTGQQPLVRGKKEKKRNKETKKVQIIHLKLNYTCENYILFFELKRNFNEHFFIGEVPQVWVY